MEQCLAAAVGRYHLPAKKREGGGGGATCNVTPLTTMLYKYTF